MRKIYSVILPLSLLFLLMACKKQKVDAPQEPQTGHSIQRQGYVSGKLTGKISDDTLISEEFRFDQFSGFGQSQFFEHQNENTGETFYAFEIERRSGENENCYLTFQADYVDTLTGIEIYNASLDFHYEKDLGNGKILKFDDFYESRTDFGESDSGMPDYSDSPIAFSSSNSTLKVRNYSFNPSTGQLKFDYEVHFSFDENTSGHPATLAGTVDVVVREDVMKEGYFVEE